MTRVVVGAALVGVLQGVLAILLVVWLGAPGDSTGWFSYTPLSGAEGVRLPGDAGWEPRLLLVPLTLAGLGAAGAYVGVRRGWCRAPTVTPSPPRRVRVAFALGLAGLVLAVVTVVVAPTMFDATVWVELPTTGPPAASRGYADYLPASGPSTMVGMLVGLIGGSAAGAAVLVALTGLREGRRWGRIGVGVTVGVGIVAVGSQLQLRGVAASTLLGEVVALALGVAALVLTRRSVAGDWFRRS
ncbi:MAG: hypothetical protein M3Y19_09655 [Actinomycetota bacterium]|nr:hypothetical protein [Actinomycetota bacterium]